MKTLDETYKRIPLAELTTPPAGYVQVIKDHWWCVTPDSEALLYRGHAPQCNVIKGITERLMPEGCHAELIPVAFIKINLSDYS